MLKHLYNINIWIRLVVSIWAMLVVAWTGMIVWASHEQRATAFEQAKEFAVSVHQMTLAGLTGMMITGTIGQREVFLHQIERSNNIRMLKVLRGPAVVGQFGAGRGLESHPDAAEQEVMRSGKTFSQIDAGPEGETMRVIMPVVASSDYLGKNCLACHHVAEGTVLGAVSMNISLANVQRSVDGFTREILFIATLISLPLLAFIYAFINHFVTKPLRRMTEGLRSIARGEVELSHLPVQGRDEIGQATAAFNSVMERANRLVNTERLAAKVFDNAAECIMVCDRASVIQMVNRAFCDTTGYEPREAIGRTPGILNSGRHDAEFFRQFRQALQEEGRWQGEIWNRRKDGVIFPEWLNVSTVRSQHGEIDYFVAIFSDITDRKAQEDLILRQATHDSLTDLPNRTLFKDRLDQAIARQRRSPETKVGVMLLDLDRFKIINDTLGHSVGDDLLREVAQRIREALRQSDTVARLGGDEFTVVLPELKGEQDAVQIAEKILSNLKRVIQIGSHELFITPSIGIAIHPDHGEDVDVLLKRADAAMYHVKEQGRNNFYVYGADLERKPTLRLELESQLYNALEKEEFIVYYQPQVDLHSGEIYGAEALIRWRHPIMGLVPPSDFIPLSEETGLIVPIGAWVIQTVCMQAKHWMAKGQSPLLLAVNLSPRQFQRGDVVKLVREALDYSGLPPQNLELEITETLAMQDADYTIRTLQALADLGVQLAIDDFGTGYSSLSYLKKMPVNTLKIDRSFVRDITIDADDAAIVSAVTSMAHRLGLKIIAEGVENREQLESLRALGCDRAQGYLFSRPLPTAELEKVLAGHPRW